MDRAFAKWVSVTLRLKSEKDKADWKKATVVQLQALLDKVNELEKVVCKKRRPRIKKQPPPPEKPPKPQRRGRVYTVRLPIDL